MSPLKVSVCVVAYNQENYIRQCLQSIVDQQSDFEVEQIMQEMIKQYLENHFEPNLNDEFQMEPSSDPSLRRRVSGLLVRNKNPLALASDCLYFG